MFYIGYYTTPNDVRISSPAANAKIISISEAFVANEISVVFEEVASGSENEKLFNKYYGTR